MPKLPVLILPAILAIALYFIVSGFNTPTQNREASLASFPTELLSISEGINTVTYDEQGAIAYTLRAERQTHRNDDSSELERPVIRLFQDNQAQWNIVASSGNISAQQDGQSENSRRLTLNGDVQLVSLDQFGNRTTLDTDFLIIMPDQEMAETDRQVLVRTNNIEQSATGMIAKFGIDEITFLSNSEGRYDPHSP